jgi:hypothetical protein
MSSIEVRAPGMPAHQGGKVPEVASEAEIEAQFKELGLPLGLIEHLQIAPAPLHEGSKASPSTRQRVAASLGQGLRSGHSRSGS